MSRFGMPLLFCVVAAMFASAPDHATAARYYVSLQGGDDGANGTTPQKAGGAAGPWKTLARASRQEYRNGDELLLRCGETHTGNLDLRIAQGEGYLRVAAFGDCAAVALPRLDATHTIDLMDSAGRRRVRLDSEPSRVVVADKLLPRGFARFKITQEGGNASTLRLQPALPPGANLTQAQAYARTRDWFVEPVRLNGALGGPAGLGEFKTQYPIAAGVTLVVTGKEWTLQNNAWIFDDASKELVLLGTTGDVRVADRQPLVKVRGSGSVLIDGLQFAFAGEDAIDITIKGTATVRRSTFISPARRAIHVQTADSLSVMENSIAGAGEDAIFIGTAGKVFITRNTIQDTAIFEPHQPAVGAVNVARATSAVIEENTVQRSAYVGIRFGEGATVRSNAIVDSCMALSDCAAIYTWQKTPSDNRRPSLVAGNLVVGVHGNDDVKLGFKVWAVGIYLDDFTSQVRVEDNAIFGARQGIYLHNAFQNRLSRNISVGDTDASMSVYLDSQDAFLRGRTNLGNDVSGGVMLPSDKADTLSVVRRARLEPFSAFRSLHLGKRRPKSAIAWLDNTGDFDRPSFKSATDTNATAVALGKSMYFKDATDAPASTSWRAEPSATGFRVTAGGRIFRLEGGAAPPDGCKELAALEAGPHSLAGKRTTVSDCAQ